MVSDRIGKKMISEPALPENIYGHANRLRWIETFLRPDDRILEFGCGTGYMITRPLLAKGYDITGIDADRESIALGKSILAQEGLDPERLICGDLGEVAIAPDVIIASEVLEHLSDGDLDGTVRRFCAMMHAGGSLLVTVPNGWGCFELEDMLWNRLGLRKAFACAGIGDAITWRKMKLLGAPVVHDCPSSLSASPHLQRFSRVGIQKRLDAAGFVVQNFRGSALCAGPLSNLFLTGIGPVMRLNIWLGGKIPAMAAGFYLHAVKKAKVQK